MNTRQQKIVAKLKAASSVGTLDMDPKAFAYAVKGESDRGAIILSATMVDDRLRHALELHTPVENDSGRKKFMNRVKSNFASRTELAHELGLISSHNRDMIEIVREMRNACAHGRNRLTFRDQLIVEAMGCLIAESNGPLQNLPPKFLRDAFVMLCGGLAATISGGTSDPLSMLQSFVKTVHGGANSN